MRYLALDLATTVGWARAEDRHAPSCGTFRLPSCGENYGLYAAEFRVWLNNQITAFEPHHIVFESPIHIASDALPTVRKLYSLCTLTELACWDRSVKVAEAHVKTVRTHFLGRKFWEVFKGRDAQKRAVIAECRARGWEPPDDNAADALALLDLFRSQAIEGFNSRRAVRDAA